MYFGFIALGLLMVWQGLGAFGVVPMLSLSLFRNNIFFTAATIGITKFAIVLGAVSCLYGVAGLILKTHGMKKGVTENSSSEKSSFDAMAMVVMVILFMVTIV